MIICIPGIDMMRGKLLCIYTIFQDRLVGIDHGPMSALLDPLSESQHNIRILPLRQFGVRDPSAFRRVFNIDDDRIFDRRVSRQHFQDKFCLFYSLLRIDSLAVEINAHRNARCSGLPDIGIKTGIFIYRSCRAIGTKT